MGDGRYDVYQTSDGYGIYPDDPRTLKNTVLSSDTTRMILRLLPNFFRYGLVGRKIVTVRLGLNSPDDLRTLNNTADTTTIVLRLLPICRSWFVGSELGASMLLLPTFFLDKYERSTPT